MVRCDAVAKGGSSFAVVFPSPVSTKCVGVVIDDVYPANKGAPKGVDPSSFIHEVVPRIARGGGSLDEIAARLNGQGPDRSKAELAILGAAGPKGIDALVRAYPKLDGPGRDAARRVIDAADCDDKLALYVPLLVDRDAAEADRARDRVRRCGKAAGPRLLDAMRAAVGPSRDVFAEEAALVAPGLVVPVLFEALVPLSEADGDARRALRHALAKASVRASGPKAFDATLSSPAFAAAPLVARVDVLRALGEGIARSSAAPAAFSAAAAEAKAFRERYLLLGPAGELAKAGDEGAARFVAAAFADPDLRLRARAAQVGGAQPALRRLVAVAIDDREVRVRRAALEALASGGTIDPPTALAILGRLGSDGWSAVRLGAAGALRFAPKGDPVDARLGLAVDFEPSPLVRAEMVRTLGERGARAQAPVLISRASDDKEALDVRLAAVRGLGELCDGGAIDLLGELALKGRAPFFEADRKLSVAAIIALGRMAPPDLDARLAPLRAEGVPGDIRDIVKATLAKRGGCDGVRR